MVKRLKNWLNQLFSNEKCAHSCALACAFGVYVAFSPFFGLHTLMVIAFSWLFSLNFGIMLAVSIAINNPWTMIPVYGSGYFLGDWILGMFNIDQTYNPAFCAHLNQLISAKLGFSAVSLWAYLLGGNILGLFFGFLTYPLVRHYLQQTFVKPVLRFTKPKALAKLCVFKASRAMQKSKSNAKHMYLTIMYTQFSRPRV